MMRMMKSPTALTGPVNIGNPVENTMLELAEQVLKLTGSKSKLMQKALPLMIELATQYRHGQESAGLGTAYLEKRG